jgi:hypothetical protein
MTADNVAGLGEEDYSQTENNVETFPESWKEEFEGLLFLGYLQKEVTQIPFHKFIVRTLTVNEKIEISLLTKPYIETVGFNRAWKAATVAAGLVSVDGKSLITGNKNLNTLQQKYDYVVNNWYDIVIEILYNEIDALEGKSIIVLQELGIIEPVLPASVFEDDQESDTPKGGN